MNVLLLVFSFCFRQYNCLDGNLKESFQLIEWSKLQQYQLNLKEARSVDVPVDDEDLDLDYDTVARIASLPLHCHSVISKQTQRSSPECIRSSFTIRAASNILWMF